MLRYIRIHHRSLHELNTSRRFGALLLRREELYGPPFLSSIVMLNRLCLQFPWGFSGGLVRESRRFLQR